MDTLEQKAAQEDTLEQVANKVLLKLYDRMLVLTDTVEPYLGNMKGLKICTQLVRLEKSTIEKTKNPIEEESRKNILWQYETFLRTLKQLTKTSNAEAYTHATAEWENFVKSVHTLRDEYDAKVNPQKTLSEKVADTASVVGDKIASGITRLSEIVKEGADKLKKSIAGGD